ncbi:MAG TPA: hypothetical protein VN442_22690 [Bryobacteraceae bacterium]|nr:hypothetical protein [Bryobacteraceae bacterium]
MRRLLLALALCAPARALDLTGAALVCPPTDRKACGMLLDEVERRSQVRWQTGRGAAVTVTVERGSGPVEGYRVRASGSGVTVTGNDSRGVLYGVGRLLRAMEMRRGAITLADGFSVTTAPKYRLRGHQLGYRPKTNSYDAWDVPMWEQYIRDLAVFGVNAIELLPPRSDDDAESPHYPLPSMRMMTEMSRLADEYGLDVWIWYPAMDKDYGDPATVEAALREWGEIFRQLPRVDAVFVPGGDPGHTQPKLLMALLEKQTAVLHRYHPKAQMWMSPQGFDTAWMEEFHAILKKEPAWLSGIVFGPQVRQYLPELRAQVPARYPIRHYPDITHTRQCQFPVPDWDAAYSATLGREPINPRPMDQARIFRLLQPHTIGFITYSEGCNDDVNKVIWSALGWDAQADVTTILREYGRYFIGPDYADAFAQGLLALERNWRGPLASNAAVSTTLQQFQDMEKTVAPAVLRNWRFQQGLYRAYYDAATRSRLVHETAAEEQAMARLREAPETGALAAIARAEAILDHAAANNPAADWRARVFELAEALFQSARMQLSVPRYKAIAVGRGANLDTLDVPLNNRAWLKRRFAALRGADEPARLDGIREILHWTDPGPGGFYDDLGNLARQPHLVRGPGFSEDPAFLRSSLVGFSYNPEWRSSWWDDAQSLIEQPLEMRYTGLDPGARYKLRVVYGGDSLARKIRLVANRDVEIHPLMAKPAPVRPVEFDIPQSATQKGVLLLSWTREPGLGGNGRGCQVSEVWLIRK